MTGIRLICGVVTGVTTAASVGDLAIPVSAIPATVIVTGLHDPLDFVAHPSPTDPLGCDVTYDLRNLGSYGVQYWFFSSLANGTLNVGIGCLPAPTAQRYATSAASSANGYPSRFVTCSTP